MWTGKPQHLKGFDYRGPYRYFLTFCTNERRRVFVKADAVDLVGVQILRALREQQFALFAYCYMPDHAHLLVEGQSAESDCKRFIASAKQYSGYYYKQAFGDPLWQRYGYERTLRSDEATLSVARYLVENPVRAGLARHPLEYPYVGSGLYSLEEILEAVQLDGRWRQSR